MLVMCKEKLRPFTDEGFTHKDRQKKRGETSVAKSLSVDFRTEQLIKMFKQKLTACIKR